MSHSPSESAIRRFISSKEKHTCGTIFSSKGIRSDKYTNPLRAVLRLYHSFHSSCFFIPSDPPLRQPMTHSGTSSPRHPHHICRFPCQFLFRHTTHPDTQLFSKCFINRLLHQHPIPLFRPPGRQKSQIRRHTHDISGRHIMPPAISYCQFAIRIKQMQPGILFHFRLTQPSQILPNYAAGPHRAPY